KWFEGLVFPWLTLSVLYVGFYARVLRANLVETENEDYMRTARPQRISERRDLIKQNLRTSRIAFASRCALDFALCVASGALPTGVVPALRRACFASHIPVRHIALPVMRPTVIYGDLFIGLAGALVRRLAEWLDARVPPTEGCPADARRAFARGQGSPRLVPD